MKKLLCFVLFFGTIVLGAVPQWYYEASSDPELITGKGTARLKGISLEDAKEMALQEALTEISRQIIVQVNSRSRLLEMEAEEYSSFISKEVHVQSCVQMCNFQILKSEADRSAYYVLAGVERDALTHFYLNKLQENASEALAHHNQVENLIIEQPKEAMRFLHLVKARLLELQESLNILSALKQESWREKVPQIDELPSLGEVEGKLSQLQGNRRQDYDELASDLIAQLPDELKSPKSYALSYFEWLNTGFSSEFSISLSEYLSAVLEREFGWYKAVKPAKPEVVISGQILSEADKIIVLIRSSGSASGVYALSLSPATVAHIGMDKIMPQNLQENISLQKQFLLDSLQKGELTVRARFPRFENSTAIYKVGEDTNIFIKANKPCYITVINVEADGRWNVLEQNRRISNEMVGEWVSLYGDFVVSLPAGVEQLFIQASTSQLPIYPTTPEYVDEGMKNICHTKTAGLAQTRGLVIKASPAEEYTEEYLSWTVLK